MSDVTGHELSKLCAGDKAAWDCFVERHYGVIYAAVARNVGIGMFSEEDRRDVCQDVFVRLCKHEFRMLKTFDPARASIITWLTIIARGVSIDFLRRRRLPTVPAEEAPEVASNDEPAPSGPELIIPEGLLSAQQSLVLQLLFDRDLDVPEAARILGVTEQTIRSTKHKALTALRAHFKEHPRQ